MFNSLCANSRRFVNHYLKISIEPVSHSLLFVFQNNQEQKNLSGRAQEKVSFTFHLEGSWKRNSKQELCDMVTLPERIIDVETDHLCCKFRNLGFEL